MISSASARINPTSARAAIFVVIVMYPEYQQFYSGEITISVKEIPTLFIFDHILRDKEKRKRAKMK